jgi:NAD(P)-dependent dehydrogenase (short-subunit alcohol dehydrogenase family)
MSSLAWFITGTSKGFGLDIARVALELGDSVVATARDPSTIDRALGSSGDLLTLELDVTNEEQARACATAAIERFGRIDVLVNNAGRGLLGAVEEATDAEVRSIFEVNVHGLLNVTRAVLPSMRARHAGRIMNMSSEGGFSALSGWGVYCATKFAIEGLSEAMRDELAPLGIRVILIEPGTFRTDFLAGSSLKRTERRIDGYEGTAGASRRWADESNQAQLGDPTKAAAAIVEVAASPDPPFRLPLGSDCVARIEEKLDEVTRELESMRSIAMSTDYEEGGKPAPTGERAR